MRVVGESQRTAFALSFSQKNETRIAVVLVFYDVFSRVALRLCGGDDSFFSRAACGHRAIEGGSSHNQANRFAAPERKPHRVL